MQDGNPIPVSTTPVPGSTQQKVEPVDFTVGYLQGIPAGDIAKFAKDNGRPLVYSNFDATAKALKIDPNTNPEQYNQQKSDSQKQYGLVQKGVAFEKSQPFYIAPDNEESKWTMSQYGLANSTLFVPTITKPVYTGSQYQWFNGNEVQVNNPVAIANTSPIIKTQTGTFLPKERFGDLDDNTYKIVKGDLTKNEPEYYYQAVPDGHVVSTEEVRPIGGGEYKGFIQSIWPTITNSINASVSGTVGDILDWCYTAGNIINKNLGLEEATTGAFGMGYERSKTDKVDPKFSPYADMINYAKSAEKKPEELDSRWSSVSSFGINLLSDFAGFVPMMVTGGITGKVVEMIPSIAKYAPKMAQMMSLAYMSASMAGSTSEQMRDAGATPGQRAAFYWPYFAITYGSMKLLGPNVISNFWGQKEQLMAQKGINDVLKGVIDKGVSPVTAKWYARQSLQKSFQTVVGNGEKLFELAEKNRVMRGVISGTEMSVQMSMAHALHNPVSSYFNYLQDVRSEQIKGHYNGVSYKNNHDGTYTKTQYGNTKKIDQGEYDSEMQEQEFVNKVDSGENKIPISWDFTDDFGVFWSAALMGGFSKHNYDQNKLEQSEQAKLAHGLEMGTIKQSVVDDYINKKVDKLGVSDAHDIDNNIIENEQRGQVLSQRQVAIKRIQDNVQMLRDIAKTHGVGVIDQYRGYLDKDFLASEAILKMRDNIQLSEKLKTTEDKAEQEKIQQSMDKNSQDIMDNITPKKELSKDDPDYDPDGKTSKKYTEEFNKIGMMTHLFEDRASEDIKQLEKQKGKEFTKEEKKEAIGSRIGQYIKLFDDPGITPQKLFDSYKEISQHHSDTIDRYVEETNKTTQKNVTTIKDTLDKHIERLKSTISSFENIKPGTIDEAGKNTHINSINDLLAGSDGLNDLISKLDEQKVRGVSIDVSQELAKTMDMYHESLAKLNELINKDEVPGLKDLIESSGSGELTRPSFLEDKQPTELTRETLTPDDKQQISVQMMSDLPVGTFNTDYSQFTPDTNGETLDKMIDRLSAYSDNEQLLIKNPDIEKDRLRAAIHQIGVVGRYTTFNKGYFQDTVEADPTTKEHSLLTNKPQQRLEKGDVDLVKGAGVYYLNQIDGILRDIAKKAPAKEHEQVIIKVHYLHNQVLALHELMESKDPEVKKIVNDYFASGIIDHIAKTSGKDNPELSDFATILDRYNQASGDSVKDEVKNKEIRDTLDIIEKGVNTVHSKLSGKLGKDIADFQNTFSSKFKGLTYGYLKDYEGIASYEKKKFDSLSGQMAEYAKGKLMYEHAIQSDLNWPTKKDDPTNAMGFYVYTKLTDMVKTDRMGKNGRPTLLDIRNAHIEALKNLSGTSTEIMTYEQEQIHEHVMGFINSDTVENSVFGKKVEGQGENEIRNGLIIRGLAGAGKTTAEVLHIASTQEELRRSGKAKTKGDTLSIALIGTHNKLKEEHEAIIKRLGEGYTNVNVKYHTIGEVSKDTSIMSPHDIVFFDETSAYTGSELNAIKNYQDEKIKYLFLLDDGQIGDENTNLLRHDILYSCEKTVPASQVFRTGIDMFHNTQMMAREDLNNYLDENAIKHHEDGMTYNDSTHGQVGLRYVTNKDDIYKNFITEMNNADSIKRKGILLIVDTKAQRDEIIANKSLIIPEEYHENVRFTRRALDDEDHAISGLKATKTFIAIDFFNGKEDGPMDRLRKTRVELTSVSRAQLYMEMIGDNDPVENVKWNKEAKERKDIIGLNDTINNIESDGVTVDDLKQKQILRDEEIDRLKRTNPDVEGSEQIRTSEPVVDMDILDHKLTPEERDVMVKEMPEYESKLRITPKEDATRVTNLPEIETIISKKVDSDVTKERNSIFRKMFDLYYSGKINDVEQSMPEIVKMVEQYNDAVQLYNAGAEAKHPPIKDVGEWVTKVFNMFTNLPLELEDYKNNPLMITGPSLVGTDINGNPVHGDPLLIEVVGKTKDGKTIVDIIDIQQMAGQKKTFGDYDLAKYGSYMNMLPSDYVLNNVKVIPVSITTKGGLKIKGVGNTISMTPEEKITADGIGKTILTTTIPKYEKVSTTDYFSTAHYVDDSAPDGKPLITTPSVWRNTSTDIAGSIEGIYMKTNPYGQVEKFVRINTRMGTSDIPYSKFVDTHILAKVGSDRIPNDRFNQSAKEHKENKTFVALSASTSSDIPQSQLPMDKSIESRSKVWNKNGEIHNPHMATVHLLQEGLYNSGAEVSYRYVKDYSAYDDKGNKTIFNHAVVIDVDRANALKALEHIKGEVSNKKMIKTELKTLYEKLLGTDTHDAFLTKILNGKDTFSVGIRTRPEWQFSKNTDISQVPDSKIGDVLKLDTREQAIDAIKNLYEGSFKDDVDSEGKPTVYQGMLRDMNKKTMLMMWDMSHGKELSKQTIESLVTGASRDTYIDTQTGKKELTKGRTVQEFEDMIGDYNMSILKENMITGQEAAPVMELVVGESGRKSRNIRVWAERFSNDNKDWQSVKDNAKQFIKDINNKYQEYKKKGNGKVDFDNYIKLNEQIEGSEFTKLLKANTNTDLLKMEKDVDGVKVSKDKDMAQYVDVSEPRLKFKGMLEDKIKNYTNAINRVDDYISKGNDFFKNIINSDGTLNKDNAKVYVESMGTPQMFVRSEGMDLDVFNDSGASIGEPTQENNVDEDGLRMSFRSVDKNKDYTYTTSEYSRDILNHILGESIVKSHVKGLFEDNWVLKPDGERAFGKVYDAMIYLSNRKGYIAEFTERHEAMEFIMLHMLSPKGYASVMKDIASKIGEGWDGTRRSLLEHASDTFMTQDIPKPKTSFEKFIYNIQRFFRNLIHGQTLNGLMTDIRQGFFANGEVHDSNDVSLDETYRSMNRYNNPKANEIVKNTFGTSDIVEKVVWQVLVPTVIKNSHLGREIMADSPSSKGISPWFNAIKKTYDKLETWKKNGELRVNITNGDGKVETMFVKDMTKEHFDTALSGINIKDNDTAYQNYVKYQLSHNLDVNAETGEVIRPDYLSKIMLNKVVPNMNIDSLLDRSRNIGQKEQGFGSKDNVDISARMPDTLTLALHSIPMRIDKGELSDNKNRFVNGNVMHGILIDTALMLQVAGERVTYANIIGKMNEMYKSEIMKDLAGNKYRQHIGSFLKAFGDGDYVEAGTPGVDYNLPSYGLYRLMKESDTIKGKIESTASLVDKSENIIKEFDNKIQGWKEFFGAIESTYKSLSEIEMRKGTVAPDGTFFSTSTQYNNTTLGKEGIKNNIINSCINRSSGFLKTFIGDKIVGEGKVYDVTNNGVSIKLKDGSWKQIIDGKYNIDNVNMVHYATIFSDLFKTEVKQNVLKSIANMTVWTDNKKMPTNYFGKQLSMMMMASKLNVMYERGQLDASNPELKELLGMYKSSGYTMESMSTTLGKGTPTETMDAIPKPTDMYRFLQLIAEGQKYDDGNMYSRFIIDVKGERRQIHTPSNNLTRTAGLGSESHIATLTKELQQRIAQGDLRVSPLVVDGMIDHPFANGLMTHSRYDLLSGAENDYLGVPWNDMTTSDKMKFIIDSTYNDMAEQGGTYSEMKVLAETFADKTQKYGFTFKLKDNVPVSMPDVHTIGDKDNRQRVVREIKHQYQAISPIIDNFVRYYERVQQFSLDRWNNYLGKQYKTLDELKSGLGTLDPLDVQNKLIGNKDYHIKDGKVILGNDVTLSFSNSEGDQMWYDNTFINKWKKLSTPEEKMSLWWDATRDSYQSFVDLLDENHVEMTPEMERLQPDIPTTPELLSAIGEVLKKHSKWNDLTGVDLNNFPTTKKLDFLRKTYLDLEYNRSVQLKEVNEKTNSTQEVKDAIRNKIIDESKKNQRLFKKDYNKVMDKYLGSVEKSGNPLLQSVFMSYHLFNEAQSQLSRGGALSAAGVGDHIKRGAGFVAPGQGYNSEMLRYSKALHVQDIGGSNPLFSDRYDPELNTNGQVIANPIEQELKRRQSGGFDGIVTDGMQKPNRYYYDPISDELIYVKSADDPINGQKYRNSMLHQSRMRTMLGPELFDVFDRSMKENRDDFKTAVNETTDYVENNYLNKGLNPDMIGYLVHSSAFKLGQKNLIKYKTLDGSDQVTLANAHLDLTPEERQMNTFNLDNENYVIQQITAKDTQDPYKSIPVQALKTIGVGDHNADLADRMNTHLSDMLGKYRTKISTLNTYDKVQGYLKDLAQRSLISGNQTGVYMDDVQNEGISMDIYRNKEIALLLADANKWVKPSMPGTSLNQAPADYGGYRDQKTGKWYLAKDKGQAHDRMQLEGFDNDELKPMSAHLVNEDGTTTEYTDKATLLSHLGNKKIIVSPAEVICQFPYMKQFGITSDQSLMDSMTVRVKGGKTNFYATGLSRALNGERTVDDYHTSLRKMYEGMDYKEIVNSLPDNDTQRKAIRFWQTESQMKTVKEKGISLDNKEVLLLNMAAYFKSYNDALDTFSVRIPTGSASSMFMGRIVAFDNDSANTIYTSAKKSLLDGSDYDIDALQTYFNAVKSYADDPVDETTSQKRADQQAMFGMFKEYFNNPLNLQYQLQETTTANVKKAADAVKDNWAPNSIDTMIKSSEYNSGGQKLIATEASGENAFNTVLNIPSDVRQKFDKRFTALRENDSVLNAIGVFMEFINAGTDAAKLNGAPGKLNINQYTAPYSTGLTAEGKGVDEIIAALSDPDILKATKIVESSNNIVKSTRIESPDKKYKVKLWHGIDQIIANVKVDPLLTDIEKTARIKSLEDKKITCFAGEVLRQVSVLSKIQQKIASNEYEFYKRKIDTKQLLGMPMDVFMTNIDTIRSEGGSKFHNEYKGQFEDPYNLQMRETLDGSYIVANSKLLTSYIELIRSLDDTFDKGVSTRKYLKDSLEERDFIQSLTDRDIYENEETFNKVHEAVEKHITGKFLSTLDPASIKFRLSDLGIEAEGTDDLITMKLDPSKYADREMFNMLMPSVVKQLKVEYPNNYFIEGLSNNPRGKYTHIEFKNSIYLNDAAKSLYRNAFNQLPNEVRDLFMRSQMDLFGHSRKQGAMTEIIDNDYKARLSEFIKNDTADIEGLGEHIIVKEGIGRTDKVTKDGVYKTVTDKIGNKFTYYLENGNKVFKFDPTWKDVNTYGTKDSPITDYRPAPDIPMEDVIRMTLDKTNQLNEVGETGKFDLDNLRNKSVYKRLSGWNGIAAQDKTGYTITEGRVVELPTGIRVKMESDGSDRAFKLTRVDDTSDIKEDNVLISKVTTVRKSLVQAIAGIEGKVLTRGTVKMIARDMQKMLPNLKITDYGMYDSENLRPQSSAYLHKEGINLNLDKMTPVTRLHEIGHIYLMHVKRFNMPLYRELVDTVKDIQKNYPDIIDLVKNTDAYKGYNDVQLQDEIIAKMLGWSDESIITEQFHSLKVMDVDNKAKNIFTKIGDLVTKFWDYVKSVFTGTYGIKKELFDFDFKKGTIFDLGRKLSEAIKDGRVSRIDTETLEDMMHQDRLLSMADSPITETGKTSGSFVRKAMNNNDQVQFSELKEDDDNPRVPTKVGLITAEIINNGGRIPFKYTGNKFVNLKDVDGSLSAIKVRAYVKTNKLTDQFENRSKILIPKIQDWINNYGGRMSKDVRVKLGVDENNDPIYNEDLLTSFRYMTNNASRIYTLDQAMTNIKGFGLSKETYEYFKDSGIHIGVENVGKDQTVVSLYTFPDESPNNTYVGIKQSNILSSWGVSNRRATSYGLSVGHDTNTYGSVHGVEMAKLAIELSQNGNIKVHEIGSIGITPNKITPYFRSFRSTINTLVGMGKVEEYMKDVPEHLQKYFKEDPKAGGWIENTRIDFGKIIQSMADNFGQRDDRDLSNLMSNINKKYAGATIDDQKQMFSNTLDYLNEKQSLTPEEVYIQKVCLESQIALGRAKMDISEWNSNEVMDSLSNFTIPGDINNELVQKVNAIVADGLAKANYQVNERMMANKELWKEAGRLGMLGQTTGLPGMTGDNFKRLMITVPMVGPSGDRTNLIDTHVKLIHHTNEKDMLLPDGTVIPVSKLREGKNLTADDLALGQKIVDSITDMMEDNKLHNLERDGFNYYKDGDVVKRYEKKDMIKLLHDEGYKEGMIPVMTKSQLERMNSGKIGGMLQRYISTSTHPFTIYDDMPELDNIPNRFFMQMTGSNSTVFGSTKRLGELGIMYNKNEREFHIPDEKSLKQNRNLSSSMEQVLNYFYMASTRKNVLETEVLPLVSAIKVQTKMQQLYKGANLEIPANWIDKFESKAVFNKRYSDKLSVGTDTNNFDVINGMQVGSNMLSTMVLGFNFGIGVFSFGVNYGKAFAQAVGNSFYGFGGGVKDFSKASAWATANPGKAMELSRILNIIDMDSRNLMSLNMYKQSNRTIWDQTIMSGPTFWGHYGVRAIQMISDMMKDGSLDAWTFNKNGRATYDWTKDGQWKDIKTNPKTKAVFDETRRELIAEGRSRSSFEGIDVPYTLKDARRINAEANRIEGGFTNKDKVIASNTFVGQAFSVFKNFFFTAYQDAFKRGGAVEEQSKIVPVFNEKSQQWEGIREKLWTEGYSVTLARNIYEVFRDGNIESFTKMQPFEKANYMKIFTKVATFVVMTSLYNLLVHKKGDKDSADKPIQEIDFVKKWQRIANSLFVLPQIIEFAQNPFAALGMLDRYAKDSVKGWEDIKNGKMPKTFSPGVKQLEEIPDITDPNFGKKNK